jgi:transposase
MANQLLNYSKLIQESESELKEWLSKQKHSLVKRRLRFLLLLKTTPDLSCAAAGGRLGLGERGARKMWDLYQKQGMNKYLDYPYKGRASKLQAEQKQWLLQKAKAEELLSLKDTVHLLEQEQHIHYSLSAVHYIFKALHIKKKTGRPSHIHKDEQRVEDFKKKTFPL